MNQFRDRPDPAARLPRATPVRFTVAPGAMIGGDSRNENLERVIEAYLPFQPVTRVEAFAGRATLLRQLVAALEEYRNHVVVFGPPGAGKTSLAMVLSLIAERSGYQSFYVSRSRSSTLRSILEPILARLPRRFDRAFDRQTTAADATFADLLPAGPLAPTILSDILARISGTRVLIVIDEINPAHSDDTEADILELMKLLSDRGAPVHIVAIGVARSAEQLFGGVTELPRSLFQIKLDFMSDEDMREALTLSARNAGLGITEGAVNTIIRIARGKAFIGKLVGLSAAKIAAARGAQTITEADLDDGLAELVQRFDVMSAGRWEQITAGNRGLFGLLGAAVAAPRDSMGAFTLDDILHNIRALGWGAPDKAAVMAQIEKLVSGDDRLLEDVSDGARRLFRFISLQVEVCVAIFCSKAQPS